MKTEVDPLIVDPDHWYIKNGIIYVSKEIGVQEGDVVPMPTHFVKLPPILTIGDTIMNLVRGLDDEDERFVGPSDIQPEGELDEDLDVDEDEDGDEDFFEDDDEEEDEWDEDDEDELDPDADQPLKETN